MNAIDIRENLDWKHPEIRKAEERGKRYRIIVCLIAEAVVIGFICTIAAIC